MLHHSSVTDVFRALADPTRLAMVERLSKGAASVSELAEPFPVSLTAIGQHLQLLEASGLVRSVKTGRVRRVELVPDAFTAAERWFASHRKQWERKLDRLAAVLAEDDDDDAPKPTSRRSKP